MNLNGVVIRQVMREDLPGLEWEGEYTHFRRMYADAFQRAESGEEILWVAEVAPSRLIGQLFVHLDNQRNDISGREPHAYLYGFRIRPVYRGRGIGSLMLRVAEQDLLQRGYRRVVLNVSRTNLEARRLYERMGYRVFGTDPGRWSYVDDQGKTREVHEPAWRMEKILRNHD